MLNKLFFTVSNNTVANGLISLLEQMDAYAPQILRVLTYHRVEDPAKNPTLYPGVTVKPEVFEQHMQFVSSHYRVVSMAEVLQAVKKGLRLPDRAVLITFDDACRDFAENAMPVLRRYRLPATLFVPTAFPGHPERAFWWDRLYVAVTNAQDMGIIQTPIGQLPVSTSAQRKQTFGQLRDYVKSLSHRAAMQWVDQFCEEVEAPPVGGTVLSWEELRKLAREGVTLGPHTRTHPMMNQIADTEVRKEAAGSWQDLRDQVGDTLPIFAYPSGGYNREVLRILEEEKFQLAFTTQRGLNDFKHFDRLQIKRINIGPKTTLALLRAQLLSWTKFIHRQNNQLDPKIINE